MKRLTAQTKQKNLRENCTGDRTVNSDWTKAMHILQATYSHTRYF